MTRKDYLKSICSLLVAAALFCRPWAGIAAGQDRQKGSEAAREYEFKALRMGTLFRILVYSHDALTAQKAAMEAFDRVETLEEVMSDYRETSEVMRLCREAVGKPQNVSPDLLFVLQNALRISKLSNGAFDVTIGPVAQLWREAKKNKRVPDPAEIKKARELVGYGNVILDPDARTVMLKIPHMKIDFGGIGKGYAVDEALEVLQSRGFRQALVQGGGEIVAGEPPPGKAGWKVAIRKPDPADSKAPGSLLLRSRAVSTSGDAFQYLEINGQRYSHIINPVDGMGLKDSLSVTTVAPNGITADALATALEIMPLAEGLKMVESIEGAYAVVTRRVPGGFQHFYSKGFPNFLGATTSKSKLQKTQRNRINEP